MTTANKTPNLNLPQYQNTDVFDLKEINDGYKQIDTSYKEIKDSYDTAIEESTLNGSIDNLELISARKGEINLKAKIDKIDSSLEDIMDYDFFPQNNLPNKKGDTSCDNKILYKVSDDEYKIFQVANNNKYLMYTLKKNVGGIGSTDTGGDKELLRVVKVQQCDDVYTWYKSTPVTGTEVVSVAPTTTLHADIEVKFTTYTENNNVISNNNGFGMTLYDLMPSTSISYNIPTMCNNNVNLLLDINNTSSDSVDILINDILVRNINCNLLGYPSSAYRSPYLVEIPVEYNSIVKNVKITIRNNNTTKKVKYFGFNFQKLNKYNNLITNNFKANLSNNSFIDGVGANDYAMFDVESNKWVGSYHGGEKVDYLKTTYKNMITQNISDLVMSEITINTFTIIKNLEIYQRSTLYTTLGKKCDLTLLTNFDVNGTLSYNFGLSNNNIKTSFLYTALTCTATNFKTLYYPYYDADITTKVGSDGLYKLKNITNGYITQYNISTKMELASRYIKFNNKYNNMGDEIWCTANYNKHYYGIVRGHDSGVVIPSLSWSKCLDFIFH